jgi:secondary thiamine-phosphate synthase enzyme
MKTHTTMLRLKSAPKRTVEFTADIAQALKESRLSNGVVHVFCRHTSCSLVIMENADPSARRDLERFIDRLVPENDPAYTHTMEGPDDMPSHIKMALTRTSETIPFHEGRLLLGTWQGVFLWEHRAVSHTREIVVTLIGTDAVSS